jgi:selenocysteine-specific elongation factor
VAEGAAVAVGTGFLAPGRGASADPRAAAVLEALAADGLEPRSRELLAASLDATKEQIGATLDRLAVERQVVRVKPGLYYHRDALEEVRRRVIEACRRDGAVTIAGLRDELGTSRKYAQALLEHFDGQRLTRRRGDEHVLR